MHKYVFFLLFRLRNATNNNLQANKSFKQGTFSSSSNKTYSHPIVPQKFPVEKSLPINKNMSQKIQDPKFILPQQNVPQQNNSIIDFRANSKSFTASSSKSTVSKTTTNNISNSFYANQGN